MYNHKRKKALKANLENNADNDIGQVVAGLIVATQLLFMIGTSFSNSFYQSVPAGGTIMVDIVEVCDDCGATLG